jgi:hypothetical protein
MTPFMMAALLLGLDLDVVPLCFSSDIQKFCCPSACAVKNSPKWTQADGVLRGCMKGIHCSDGESNGATVGMKCNCTSK